MGDLQIVIETRRISLQGRILPAAGVVTISGASSEDAFRSTDRLIRKSAIRDLAVGCRRRPLSGTAESVSMSDIDAVDGSPPLRRQT
jgi:hypothetical protein